MCGRQVATCRVFLPSYKIPSQAVARTICLSAWSNNNTSISDYFTVSSAIDSNIFLTCHSSPNCDHDPEMSVSPFSVTICDPTCQISDETRLTDHKQNTDPTRPDQVMMTPKFPKCNINILHAVKFTGLFKNVKSCVHPREVQYA